MKTLKYGFFGEDEAQRIFLANYLEQLVLSLGKSEELVFEYDQEFAWRFRGIQGNNVDSKFAEAAQFGFVDYQQDVFFVGRDLDTNDTAAFQAKVKLMEGQLQKDFQDKTFLLLPVQCIEHWLWYLKIKQEKPNNNKNENLEKNANKLAKIALYGSARATNKVSSPIVESLSKNLDIEHLESRSQSFLMFHKRVEKFINTTVK